MNELINGLTASGFKVIHSEKDLVIMRGDIDPSERRDHAEWLRRALERAEQVKQGWRPPADFNTVRSKVGYAQERKKKVPKV